MYSVIKCLLVLVLTAVCAAQPSFAASPRYVEGEAIVMLRQGISAGTAGASAKSVANGAADAASELGAVVVHNFLPVKAAADSENSVNCGGAARTLSANGDERGGETYAVAQLRSAGGENTEEFIARLRANPNVVSAMPNYIMRLSAKARGSEDGTDESAAAVPDDPLYEEQWGLSA